MNKTAYRYWIGIDTGVNTGITIWDRKEKKLIIVHCVAIHVAWQTVTDYHRQHPGQVFVRVEDARLRKWIPKDRGRAHLQGAGSIKRDASMWEGFLKDLGVAYEMVAPKNNRTKMTADYFKRITGWTGKTNEHARDSAMLVYGM